MNDQQKRNREAWFAALRSGKFVQVGKTLRTPAGEVCALGVAGEIICQEPNSKLIVDEFGKFAVNDPDASWSVYMLISDWLGLEGSQEDVICFLNDRWRFSFSEIADRLEKGDFTEPEGDPRARDA